MDKSATSSKPAVQLPSRIAWRDDGWTIDLQLNNGVIAKADISSTNAETDNAFLRVLEKSLVGMSPRQARDHGVQYVCAKQEADGVKSKVAGILMPSNYSAASRSAASALRVAIDQAVAPQPDEWNFEDQGLSEAWRAIPKEDRSRKLEGLIKEFLKKIDLPDAAIVTDIDVYDRVFLQFQEDFPVAQKPPVLMQLEKHVRHATGERIELFVSEMKDNNRIRRL